MTYVVHLPDPLRHKIAGWGLPPEVELGFLEQIQTRVLSCVAPPGVIRACIEIQVPDYTGCYYGFYGRIVAEMIGNNIVLRDCDFDPVPIVPT
ncbi:MAG: hypothetical protein ABSF26_19205 [Thermoguttaceae bacterium]|jgi:hypothetical protein